MQSVPLRIFLILIIIALIYPSTLLAATEKRIALVIGNSAYSSGPLKNPVNDATDMAAALKRTGFTVTLKKNANLQEMVESIEDFGNSLKRGGIGLFYYAGHGVQVNSVNYLLPINARINKESDVRFQAVDAGRVLAEMENANNGLNIVILDACRDNPFGKSFRSATRGLAIVANAPSGTFISYSTGAGQVARDGEGRNSPYTGALLDNITQPGLTINKVFMNVRSKVKKETGQVPWELSSLEGDFYFHPGSVSESTPSTSTPAVDYTAERRKVEEERELLQQKAALEEAKQKLEEEKQRLAMAKPPSVPSVIETGRDGRFIAYSDGTVLDTGTNLMWAAKGNNKSVDWTNAKSYCKNYRGGGYTDWRMPTQDELAGLYESNRTTPWKVTKLIDVPGDCWASETRGSDAAHFVFGHGGRAWVYREMPNVGIGALPVRSLEAKKEIRFIDNGNDTITDTKTGLMWAAKGKSTDTNWVDGPNGKTLLTSWAQARSYCENYRGGGYTNWRMPTQDELAGLYDKAKTYKTKCFAEVHLTELIHLPCEWVWASETRDLDSRQPCLSYESCPGTAALFGFGYTGTRLWNRQYYDGGTVALPVRFGK